MWALKRRLIYIVILFLILLIIFGLPIYRSLTKAPTCTDQKQNGDELGVDCGGSCQKVCLLTTEAPIVLWSRSVPVRNGLYNSIAMIENPNIGAGATDVPYVFRLFDEENILVYERKGRTNIASQTRFPVFEGGVFTGERKPTRTFFEFVGPIDWIQRQKEVLNIDVESEQLIEGDTPRIEAVVSNKSSTPVLELEVFSIVYDRDGNTIAGSETLIDSLNPEESRSVVFTWPEPFSSEVGRIEIIPKLNTK